MGAKYKIGILLVEKGTGKQIAVVEFSPTGMLCFSLIQKGMHVFVLKGIERELQNKGLKQPLYKKYTDLLRQKGRLPQAILRAEATFYAEALNRSRRKVTVGTHVVEATMVVYP